MQAARIDWNLAETKAKQCVLESLEKKKLSDGYSFKNSTREDRRHGSFKISESKGGVWKDFATGEGGKGYISLVLYLEGTA